MRLSVTGLPSSVPGRYLTNPPGSPSASVPRSDLLQRLVPRGAVLANPGVAVYPIAFHHLLKRDQYYRSPYLPAVIVRDWKAMPRSRPSLLIPNTAGEMESGSSKCIAN